MVGAVVEGDCEVDHGEPGKDAFLQRLNDALFHGGMKLRGTEPPTTSSENSKPARAPVARRESRYRRTGLGRRSGA